MSEFPKSSQNATATPLATARVEGQTVRSVNQYLALEWIAGSLYELIDLNLEALKEHIDAQNFEPINERMVQINGALKVAGIYEPLVLGELIAHLLWVLKRQYKKRLQADIVMGLEVLRTEIAMLIANKLPQSLPIYRTVTYLKRYISHDDLVHDQVEHFESDWVSLLAHQNDYKSPHNDETRRKLIHVYRQLLFKFFAGAASNEIHAALCQILEKLLKGAQDAKDAALLRIALALHDAIFSYAAPEDTQVKKLFARLERALSNQKVDDLLLSDIVGFIEQHNVLTEGTAALKSLIGYRLPEQAAIAPGVLSSVRQLFERAKHLVFDYRQIGQANFALSEASRLLDLAGWSSLSDSVRHVMDALISNQNQEEQVLAQQIARLFQDLELALDRTIEMTAAQVSQLVAEKHDEAPLYRQLRTDVEHIKTSFSNYTLNKWNVDEVQDIPVLVQSIRMAFEHRQMAEATQLIDAVDQLLSSTIYLPAFTPNWKQIDVFADIFVSIEEFLKQLENQYFNHAIIAKIHELIHSIPQLEEYEISSHVVGGDKIYDDSFVGPDIEFDEDIDETASEVFEEVDASEFMAALHDDTLSPMSEELSVPSIVLGNEVAAVEPEAVFEFDEQLWARIELPKNSREIDVDIVDIFIEEADEVKQVLDAAIARWREFSEDRDAIGEVRRGFHTLKGSGRMVGAYGIGELAWRVEALLNQVLGGTLLTTPKMIEAVSVVNTFTPELIHAFAQQHEQEQALTHLIYLVEDARGGRVVDFVAFSQLVQQLLDQKDVSEMVSLTSDDMSSTHDDAEVEEAFVAVQAAPMAFGEMDAITVSKPILAAGDAVDEQLRELFLTESAQYMSELERFLEDIELLRMPTERILVVLHTLKGSAGMLNLPTIFPLARALEGFLKLCKQKQHELVSDQITSVKKGFARLVIQRERVVQRQPQRAEPDDDDIVRLLDTYSEEISRNHQQIPDSAERLINLPIDVLFDADIVLLTVSNTDHAETFKQQLLAALEELESAAHSIASVELVDLSCALMGIYIHHSWQKIGAHEQALPILSTAHARLLEIFDAIAAYQPIHDISDILHSLEELAHELNLRPDIDEETITADLLVDTLAGTESSAPILPLNTSMSHAGMDIPVDTDSDMMAIFDEEAADLIDHLNHVLEQWLTSHKIEHLAQLKRDLHTLKGGARMVGLHMLADLCHELESLYDKQDRVSPNEIRNRFYQRIQHDIGEQIHYVRKHRHMLDQSAILEILRRYLVSNDDVQLQRDLAELIKGNQKQLITASQPAVDAQSARIFDDMLQQARTIFEALQTQKRAIKKNVAVDVLVEFSEQMNKLPVLLQMAAGEISTLAHQLADYVLVHQLQLGEQRSLLMPMNKGLQVIGQYLKNTAKLPKPSAVDELKTALAVQTPQSVATISIGDMQAATAVSESSVQVSQTSVSSLESAYQAQDGVPPPSQGLFELLEQRTDYKQEVVRISGELLEKLVNLSGEDSIYRRRIEMQLGVQQASIAEMERTIMRVSEQLRRMDVELESQIRSRHEKELEEDAMFDPLEMDQYSALNQLSRSLAESASDLMDFKSTLYQLNQDLGLMLHQQLRVQAEIQENLHSSRLVSFARVVPRLRRLTQQVAHDLGKLVNIEVGNESEKIDRVLLDRLIGPLEHMIRNAVDHGIESPAEREQLDKPPTATIRLNISLHSNEIRLLMTDDGRGIDVRLVRQKAQAQGLIAADAVLPDDNVLSIIFHSGFSTAQKLSQISGRGVGLDVVQSEIKQMSGIIDVSSTLGEGTTFTIMIPTSVALTDVLGVRVLNQEYAIPLAQIERVVTFPADELKTIVMSAKPTVQIDQQAFDVVSTSALLGRGINLAVFDKYKQMPLIQVKYAGRPIVMLMDEIVGSRAQIVVKPLGEQLAFLEGVSGATIEGNGSVLLVLDLLTLARQSMTLGIDMNLPALSELHQQQPLVMVVDDSVTVRKFTSKLLERAGYRVVTAADGILAMELLEHEQPHIMLLDIEMPRMDGFEVAAAVRHRHDTAELPIIMITSRTGEKHREKAFQNGVNAYMGKPYKEQELLETIHELLTIAMA